jgi:hypothetical protein
MLSPTAVARLSALTYRSDAERQVCGIPLNSIFWEDEWLPDGEFRSLPEEDQHQILHLFGMRMRISKGEELAEDRQRLWDEARAQVPNWPLFRATELSADDHLVQDQVNEDSDQLSEWFCEDADGYTITVEDGIETVSTLKDLTKDRPVDPDNEPHR